MGKKISVLIADDNKYILDSISLYLQSENDFDSVQKVTDGKEVLEIIGNRDFDVIVLDLAMPGVDGYQVMRKLKSKNVKTPVLIFTNSEDKKDMITLKKLGASGYLCKTAEPEKLISAIRSVASGEDIF